MTHLSFDVFDGIGFFRGEIADASRFGICMTDLPRKMKGESRKLKVIVTGRGESFKMHVIPKWTSDKGSGKTLGAEIMSPPLGWAEFIMSLEPKQKADVWGVVSL
jgi:hypothetical protein